MIEVRFDLIMRLSSQDADIFLHRCNMPCVPDVSETINIHGNPYIVKSRGWATGEDDKLFCYIRLIKP